MESAHSQFLSTVIIKSVIILCLIGVLLAGCGSEEEDATESATGELDISDWSEKTHGNDADPDYAIVFDQSQVKKLEIVMTAADWEAVQSDMASKYGSSFGGGSATGGGVGAGGGNGLDSSEEPDYVAVSVKFEDKEWYKVGFRLKGNSTLLSTWRNGKYKLPFRLNFDEFEDEYTQLKNQRFYGYKELSMSPGANDNSLIREKITADIFRESGVPAARTSFYRVYIDFGAGSQYCGVYTMVEVIDDTMVSDQFDEDAGNIYKPLSDFTSFSTGDFEKKNNKEENDYTDVQSTITTLNSALRTSDATLWRSTLEKTFNTSHFLKWLAINTAIVNWDSYGVMTHNYYLYHHSENGLTWIPWDHNEALRGMSSAPELSLSNVSSSWPLIRNLAEDPVYFQQYKDHLRDFYQSNFTSDYLYELIDRNHNLIAPYVVGPEATESGNYTLLTNSSGFTSSVSELKQHVSQRITKVSEFLNP